MHKFQKSKKGFQEVKTAKQFFFFFFKYLNVENVKLLLPFVSRGSFAWPYQETHVPNHPEDGWAQKKYSIWHRLLRGFPFLFLLQHVNNLLDFFAKPGSR